jgi:hypothetical protein
MGRLGFVIAKETELSAILATVRIADDAATWPWLQPSIFQAS